VDKPIRQHSWKVGKREEWTEEDGIEVGREAGRGTGKERDISVATN
jgi:hypothetical protein